MRVMLVVAAVALSAPGSVSAQNADAEARAAARVEARKAFAVEDAKNAERLRYFEGRDPIADADAAIARQDFRLLGVSGFSVDFPGAPPMVAFVPTRCGTRVIEGTGDAVSEVTRPLNQVVYAYAEAYNRRVIEKTDCLAGADLTPPNQ